MGRALLVISAAKSASASGRGKARVAGAATGARTLHPSSASVLNAVKRSGSLSMPGPKFRSSGWSSVLAPPRGSTTRRTEGWGDDGSVERALCTASTASLSSEKGSSATKTIPPPLFFSSSLPEEAVVSSSTTISSGAWGLTTRPDPRATSRRLRSAAASSLNLARKFPVLGKPQSVERPWFLGSKGTKGMTEEASPRATAAAAAARAGLSCVRRSLRSQTSARGASREAAAAVDFAATDDAAAAEVIVLLVLAEQRTRRRWWSGCFEKEF